MIGSTPAAFAPKPPPIFYPAPQRFTGTAKLYRPGGVTGGNGLTHCQLVPADAPFTGGAITLYNNQNVPLVIDSCCVAPSAQPNDGFTPVDQTGAALAWIVVQGGPWIIPPGQYTPVGLANFRPGFVKIPFAATSLARSDISGAPPLLMFRVHVASGQLNAAIPTTSQLDAQTTAYNGRRPWNGFYKSGNFAAANQAGIGTPTRSLIASLSVDFIGTVAAKTVMDFGDSTTQGAQSKVLIGGTATLHDYNGALMIACDALSTLTRPVYAANCGFQGQTVDQFTNMADVWLNAIQPHIVVGQPWSINDGIGTNQSLADAAFLKSRALLLKAKRSGMVAAWRTAIPSSSLAGVPSDAVRIAINNRCRTDPDFPCVDYDAAVTDGASPARIQSGHDSGDGTHPNASGYAQMAAAALQPFLQPRL